MGRRRRRRPLPSRIRAAVRTFLAFLFSNVGTVMLVIGYTIAGAFMFQAIEGASEMERVTMMSRERERTVQHLWTNVTLVVNPLDEKEIKQRVSTEIQRYQRLIVLSVRRGWDAGRSNGSRQWSFSNAFLYSMTVITTIGYGHLSPRTDWGKVATIVYALLGMPLFLLYLSNVGSLFARWFKCVYALVCHCRGCPGVRKRRAINIAHSYNLDISETESIERPMEWRRYSDSDVSSHRHSPYRSQRQTHQKSTFSPYGDVPYRIRDLEEYQIPSDHRTDSYQRISNGKTRSSTGDKRRNNILNPNHFHKSDYVANRHTLPKNLRYFPPDFREEKIVALKDRYNFHNNKDFKDIRNARQDNYPKLHKMNEIGEICTENKTDVSYPYKYNQRATNHNALFPHTESDWSLEKQFKKPLVPNQDHQWHVETPIYPLEHPSTGRLRSSDAYNKMKKHPDEPIRSRSNFEELVQSFPRYGHGSSKMQKNWNWSGQMQYPETRQWRSKPTIVQTNAAYRPSLDIDKEYEQGRFSRQFLRSQSIFPRSDRIHHSNYENPKCYRAPSYLPPSNYTQSFPKDRRRSYSANPGMTNFLRVPKTKDYQRRTPHRYWSERLDIFPQIPDNHRNADRKYFRNQISPKHPVDYSTHPRSRDPHFMRYQAQKDSTSYENSRNPRSYPQSRPRHEYWPARVAEDPWSDRRGWSEPVHPSSVSSEFSYVTFDPQTITVPLSVCVAIMVGYLIFGSMIFGLWERWDLLDGAYFCFISLTSIGFGDFVPGERIYTPRVETSFIVCSLYLMLGMALVAMCFNLMQEQVIHYCAGLRRAFKRICQCFRCRR